MEKFQARAIKLNPIVLITYAIFCYYITELAKYGGVSARLPVIAATGFVLLLWLLLIIFKKTPKKSNQTLSKVAKPWYYFALATFIGITSFTIYDVYQSSIPYQGRLSWYIDELKTTRKIEFAHNNIFENGIEGILEDIDTEIPLPDQLYISNEFSLTYDKEGTITSFYSSLYGENEEGETETFLINLDANDETHFTVRLGSYADTSDSPEEMRLDPLIHALNILPLKEIALEWYSETVDIYYIGERDWGYNTSGIIYYNNEKILGEPEMAYKQIQGYTTSVHLVHNPAITPKRFVFTEANSLTEAAGSITDTDHIPPEERPLEVAEEFQLNDEMGFQLVILDAALGSRFYGLTKRTEVGGEFALFNNDPFNGRTGVAAGLTFINENLGFAALSHSGGIFADLYRTIDGGVTFEQIEAPSVEIPLNGTEMYNPFDFPEMPFEEDGHLVLYVNQGADGDYNGGVRAVFHSFDDGLTWEFIQEEE